MKKLIAMLLTILIAAGMMPVGVLAENEQELPAEEPAVESETAVAEEPAEPEAGTQETSGEPEAEEEQDQQEAELAPVFTGRLYAEIANQNEIALGDTVALRAVVSDANMEYTVAWESFEINGEKKVWVPICDRAEFSFTATESTAGYYFRAHVIAEDGSELVSTAFNVVPAVREDDALTPDEEPAGQDDENDEILEQIQQMLVIVLENNGEDVFQDVNVREEADGMSAIFASLPEGAEVIVVGIEGDWVKVVTDGQTGYIYIDDLAAYLNQPADEPENDEPQQPKVEKKVTIFSSRRSVMQLGEPVVLTCKLEGYEDCEVRYIWTCDKHDGQGFQPVEGGNSETYTFAASPETFSWDWQLRVLSRPIQK